MKIVLIQAAPKRYRLAAEKGKPFRYYAPQTLNRIALLTPIKYKNELTLIDQGIYPIKKNIDADIVGISTTTCAANEGYRLSESFRKRGIKTVLGGSHPSAMPNEAKKFADSVIIGNAEISWRNLLNDFNNGEIKPFYTNFISGSNNHFSSERIKRDKHYFPVDTIELTRGCRNNCSFCVIKKTTNNQLSFIDPYIAIKEIEKMGKHIIFLDSNPFQFKKYFSGIMNKLIPMKKKWVASINVKHALNEKMIKLAKKSGCFGVLIGFESINEKSLNGANKSINKVHDYSKAIKILHDNGIGILGCFTFGFDDDNISTFEKTYEFVNKMKIDLLKYGILTPLPGSNLFDEMETQNRLITKDWSLYDTEHAVFAPKNFTPEKLEEHFIKICKDTYSLNSIMKRTLKPGNNFHYSIFGNLELRRIFKNIL